MGFRAASLARMKTISFSAARDTPKNFLASSVPVPLAWMVVPPAAPAERAASITWSVWPRLAMTTMSSWVISLSMSSSSPCHDSR